VLSPPVGLDRYTPSTEDAIRNWRKARRDAGMSCSDSSESSSSGWSSHRLVDRISARRAVELLPPGFWGLYSCYVSEGEEIRHAGFPTFPAEACEFVSLL